MGDRFETLGNATIQLFQEGRPVLATDPWLTGTCYFGSWALDHPLTTQQIENVASSDYIWISHGHPDHLHEQSLKLLRRGQRFLLGEHYHNGICNFLRENGFLVTLLPYRKWVSLKPNLRVMCLDNMNQDSILVVETGDALLINLNDSPVAGEQGFLKRLVARHSSDMTYLFALCSIDADMFNFIDQEGKSLVRRPTERKPPEIWRVARLAKRLGVRNFCCSSSQHVYARADSAWANTHRITWDDMQRFWGQPAVRLIAPFVSVDLATGAVTENHPAHQPDPQQFTDTTGDDDWAARLTPTEWTDVENFFDRFELLRPHVDYISVEVGGEVRSFRIGLHKKRRKERGVCFRAPRNSLVAAVSSGYFDDLLIGNFMQVSLVNMRLYPHFTPLVAKVGGNANVYSPKEYRKFLAWYSKRNPAGTFSYILQTWLTFSMLPRFGQLARTLRVRSQLERLYELILGNPVGR